MKLVLSDGTSLDGTSFGADRDAAGEVVFNTGMTGYTEALTDPSYRGQILVLTYPLEGNYGIPESGWESPRVQVEGLVIGRLAARASHPRMHQTLSDWLKRFDVPAIAEIDTRSITRTLRSVGTMPGKLIHPANAGKDDPEPVDMKGVAKLVTEPGIHTQDGGERRVLVIDTGVKASIIRSLRERNLTVIRAAFYENWEPLVASADAILLPNGPGDPTDLTALVDRLRAPVLGGEKPVLGICLGHQLVALAAGATTYKLPYGHRSQNQPVIDVATKRAYVTSQNHGYAVKGDSIPKGFIESYRNLNDGTNEGMNHESRPIMTAQFHPEAASGPHDTEHVFDRFAKLIFARKAAASK